MQMPTFAQNISCCVRNALYVLRWPARSKGSAACPLGAGITFAMTTMTAVTAMSSTASAQLACPNVGTVYSEQKISQTSGGFVGPLFYRTRFGSAVAGIDDLNGDGTEDMAVGAFHFDESGSDKGAVWILFLNADGTVLAEQKISHNAGNFGGLLEEGDRFGIALASLGDVDGDGVTDLAVGTRGDDDGGFERGAVWIVFLNTDGTVKGEQKISDTEGSFAGTLSNHDYFGIGVGALGDIDGDGVNDVAVGASNKGSFGVLWLLTLNTDGTVKSEHEISDTAGNFNGTLSSGGHFGYSITSLGDLDNDGIDDIAVGAREKNEVWILFLNADHTVKAEQQINWANGGFGGTLNPGDTFGVSLASLGDIDGDGNTDLAVGAHGDWDGGQQTGAVWILFLNNDGTVKAEQKISQLSGNFGGTLSFIGLFGRSLGILGDLDKDGRVELAVGNYHDNDGQPDAGAVWVLSVQPCELSCYADCDSSGALNILDYICFGDSFAAGGTYADCDNSGTLNILDYICFGDAYAAGCP